jgi:hypothetical protein
MSHEVFDTLNLVRDLQAQYAAFCAAQHFVTDQVICDATTARLEALELERCRWEGVYRNEITALALPVSAAVHGSNPCPLHRPYESGGHPRDVAGRCALPPLPDVLLEDERGV